ncbi:MAG TPA: 6-phosphogluconolactonase [Candidatus Binatia bacterium]|nr:6-phosphogluconolactonase [Candidatus Binatia bacterium]
MAMTLEVYPTDAEAFEAAAALAAARLADGSDRRTVALSGGRGGRAVMLALAARDDVPWDRVDWFWGDERCVPPDDPRSNVRLARESLLAPRAIDPARIHVPALDLGDPERIAADYATTLTRVVGARPVFDVVFLGVGTNTHIASLMPGCAALRATVPVAAVRVEEVSEEPIVARVTITPPVLTAARHVIVAVTGEAKAAPVVAALRPPDDPTRVPAQLVRPSDRISWFVDRAAAAELLRDARPAAPS